MSYYICNNYCEKEFVNIFDAVSAFRNLKIEDNFEECVIGIKVGDFRRAIYYKQTRDNSSISLLTIGANTYIENNYKYVEENIVREIKALIEVMNDEPF